MGNQWVLGLHLIFISIFLVATNYIYTCLGVQNVTVSCHEQERRALLKFKRSVRDDSGMLSSWVGSDCCSWNRVSCDSATGNVVGLHLRGNRWESYLEEENYLVGEKVNVYLEDLRHLRHLDMSGNNFQESRIPEFIGSFKQLRYLNLSCASFSGIIPDHIGNLSSLKVLDLGTVFYIPGLIMTNDMAWVSGLSSLEHLDLRNVDISQAKNINMVLYMIPSLTYLSLSECGLFNVDLGLHINSSKLLPNIKHLDLGDNHFEGQIPHFFQNMTSLTFLDLSFNMLSLTWNSLSLLSMIHSLSELHLSECGLLNAHFSPTNFNFSAHSNIQYLDLSDNSIDGKFPSELVNITSLRVLDLSANNLNSSIPVMPNLLKLDASDNMFEHIELVGIWRQCHLKELSLSRNNFDGELLGQSTNTSECSQYALEMLSAYESNFTGSLPEALGRLSNLRVLYMMSNKLTGSIPKSLQRLRSLEVLDLSRNGLTGPIPTFLGKLSNLRVLQLSLNSLTGSIPKGLQRLRSLEVLYLSVNGLTGPIPTFLGKLTQIDLSSNQFNGSIPESLGMLKGLTTLNLESNRLTGPIPTSIGQLTKLVILSVNNNYLEGVVTEAHFSNLSMLKYLQAAFNHKLIFNISHDWMPPFQLRFIWLSSCKIANGFPQWLQTQRKLQSLGLSNCSLYGIPPTWFMKMPFISEIDLSHNKLGGPLINPPSINLRILLLQDNLFNGSIPKSMCRRTGLQVLDVSWNRLLGNIPDCVWNLQDLVTLMLSSISLSGVLPSSLGNISLPFLQWLKLNDNNFHGKLPEVLKKIKSLEVMDLGNNKFSGNIPKWVGKNLRKLRVLKLHKNNLTGRFPQSLCKCSCLKILDVAHNNLTGSIPHCFGELSGMIEATYQEFYPFMDELPAESALTQVMKGIELEYTTTLRFVFNMDLSSNKFTGEIPSGVTSLILLEGLNLSHNHFSGSIPGSIGNMKALESLDFSYNQFTGMIPPSLASLHFLSCMNLSYNNLSGQIPTGNQLQTLNDDPSIYSGNRDLCGAPLPKNCSNHENQPTTTSKNKYEDTNEPKKVWFYFDIMCGFATGFCGIIGVLWFKKQWRYKLFMIAEATVDMVYVAVAVRVSKIKRGREAI